MHLLTTIKAFVGIYAALTFLSREAGPPDLHGLRIGRTSRGQERVILRVRILTGKKVLKNLFTETIVNPCGQSNELVKIGR